MRLSLVMHLGLLASYSALATPNFVEETAVKEVVYVESPTDTDGDGVADRIYVSIERPVSEKKLPTIYAISPYDLGGTDGPMHEVDLDTLPQDFNKAFKKSLRIPTDAKPVYAKIKAHSLGTGYSTGCPTVGDQSETEAAKAVIDWLNGRARGFNAQGKEVSASWANGSVGMMGVSYNGTLPIMVASTGVEGLKAIIPIGAISNWYDYYRANGLVVNPGGYIGEDADVLGFYINRPNRCKKEIDNLTKDMGREHGDFTPFWQKRNYLDKVKNIRAATFIVHGQSDWNVKQKQAIQLWEALEGVAPRRMFLHNGGHTSPKVHNAQEKMQAWLDHFVANVENGITDGPQVEVELVSGKLIAQEAWPHEESREQRFYLNGKGTLDSSVPAEDSKTIVDSGRSNKLELLPADGKLVFLSEPLKKNELLTGTAKVSLSLAVLNRKAANITVAIVEYDEKGNDKIITRGWADPQNYLSIEEGEVLVPGQSYQLTFSLEPKQYEIKAGRRLGVLLASTDYEYTIRPKAGTQIQFNLGANSFIDLSF